MKSKRRRRSGESKRGRPGGRDDGGQRQRDNAPHLQR
jgi:hypothetical protein